jgi:hypothetical protein
MVAVAVVSLLMGGGIGGIRLKRRHDYFLSQTRYFSAMEIACQERKDIFVRQINYPYYILEGTERTTQRHCDTGPEEALLRRHGPQVLACQPLSLATRRARPAGAGVTRRMPG